MHFEDWLDEKSDWSCTKKAKYLKTLIKQKAGKTTVYIGAYKTMVKSGEVFFANKVLTYDRYGNLIERSDRPRNICVPDDLSCGTLTAIQGCFWKAIKDACPGFIQGLTKKEMLHLFKSQVTTTHKSISTDGSAFDSAQKAVLMACGDNEFWKGVEPTIVKLLEVNGYESPKKQASIIVKEACKTKNMMFTKIKGINAPKMPKKMLKQFNKTFRNLKQDSRPEEDYICLPMDGTTFSGHPTRTTLGNTFRSLLYSYYYLEQAGFMECWKHHNSCNSNCCPPISKMDNIFVAAAGDDVVLWAPAKNVKKIKAVIEELTARKKNMEIQIGLGQCVTEVFLRDWWNIDFCSKIPF
jgi:hypothetical protein